MVHTWYHNVPYIHTQSALDPGSVLPSHWPTWEEVEVAAAASLQEVPALGTQQDGWGTICDKLCV